MDPVTLIVAALVAGAASGAGDVATSALKDAYAGLKSLIKKRFAGNAAAEIALDKHEKSPQAWEPALKEEIRAAGLDKDEDVLNAAQELIDHAQAAGIQVKKISQVATGDQNVQTADNHGSVSVSYGAPAPKSAT